jgi:hypothetical protein
MDTICTVPWDVLLYWQRRCIANDVNDDAFLRFAYEARAFFRERRGSEEQLAFEAWAAEQNGENK